MFPYGKEALHMKRTVISIALLLAAMLLCLPALADHSVMPGEGIMDETAAVDAMVSLLCRRLDCDEEEIRGHWSYSAAYDPEPKYAEDYSGPLWSVFAVSPEPRDGLVRADARLSAVTGEALSWKECGNIYGIPDHSYAFYEDIDFEELRRLTLIPRKDQLQPAEALAKARELLRDALKCDEEELALWRDYVLTGVTGEGRFRYHVRIGRGNITDDIWHVFLDADTGGIVWQSDPVRFAGRWDARLRGISRKDWFMEQQAEYESKWGDFFHWDYLQRAEFEEHCMGLLYRPERYYTLPGENDITFETARDAAIARIAGNEDPSRAWQAVGSCFVDDENAWIDDMMFYGIPPKGCRWWGIVIESPDRTGDLFIVEVDPATGEVRNVQRITRS